MKVAIFDFDGTLFPKDTIPFLLKQWERYRTNKLKVYSFYIKSIIPYIMYKSGLFHKSKESLKKIAVREFNKLLSDMNKEELNDFFDKSAMRAVNLLNNKVVNELQKEKEKGNYTILLSGTYEIFLQKVAKYLSIDDAIGSKLIFNEKGLIDLNIELELILGEKKLKELIKNYENKNINWEESSAYGDSFSDLGILKQVGNPVAVNPDKKLKEIAEKNRWKILI